VDAAGQAGADPVLDARAPAHAAHDEGAGVPEGARAGTADEPHRPAPGPRGLLSPTGLDRVLPEGERLSFHHTRIRATPERVWEAILARDLASSPASKALLALRGYGGKAFASSRGTFPEKLQRFGFTSLEEDPGRELVFGIAGKFWRHDGGLRRIANRQAFLDFAEDGCVKAAWNLRIDAAAADSCALSTETRIEYFGPAARRKFGLYWSLIGPFSGAIRVGLLRGVRRRAEQA